MKRTNIKVGTRKWGITKISMTMLFVIGHQKTLWNVGVPLKRFQRRTLVSDLETVLVLFW